MLEYMYVHWTGLTQISDGVLEKYTFADVVWVVCKKTRNEIALSKRRTYCVKIDKVTI